MNPKVLTGYDALACIEAEEFQSKWKTLHADCPWATACQHPDFVLAWYAHYGLRSLPVVVIGESGDAALTGLLPLVLHHDGKRLSGAGEHQAEYQGWIHRPGVGERFIVEAIRLIRKAFPEADLCLKYLPPAIPLHVLDLPKEWLGRLSLRRHRRPLMKIDAAAMERQRRKKNHRQNYNRLSRIGNVKVERIIDHDRFIDAFDEICLQYDFRQAALHRSMPFSDDPSKKPFYLQLHKNGCLHATILRVGDEIVASHIGLLSLEHGVHLGITTHAPALAAHSPGQLLLAMLGVHLADENIPWLDLTPGGDQYKEHFATDHDGVFELTLYSNARRQWQGEAVRNGSSWVKERLQTTAYRPADVVTVVRKLTDPGGYWLPALCTALKHHIGGRAGEFEYRGEQREASETPLTISKNSLLDALKFDALGSRMKYHDFLSTAMRRMEKSNNLYTLVQDKTLQMCCWTQASLSDSAQSSLSTHPAVPDAVIVSDLYVHRDVKNDELVRDFLSQVMHELHEIQPGARKFYRGFLDKRMKRIIRTSGFREKRERDCVDPVSERGMANASPDID